MSNSGGSSRVSIPNSVRKTIQDIKEITSNHSEEDIYAMLKECSMDPNETTQRLLHLDTFHEVRRKRDKRKETVKGRSAEDSRGRPGYQGRGARGGRGNSYSQYTSNDAGGRRNAIIRKENGVEEGREKGFRQFPAPVSKGADSVQQPLHVEKPSFVAVNGSVKVPNGTIGNMHGAQPSGTGDTQLSKENIDASVNNSSRAIPKAELENSVTVTPVGAIKHEVQIQQNIIKHEQTVPVPDEKGLGASDSASDNHPEQHEPQNVDGLEVSSSIVKEVSGQNVTQPKILNPSAAEKTRTPDGNSAIKSSSLQGVEEIASKLGKLKFPDGQHVIIPDHIQVPDAVKNVLSFGSIDASFGVKENNFKGVSNEKSKPAADLTYEETASDPPACDQEVVPTAPEGKDVDRPQSPSHESENNPPTEPKVPSAATVPKNDKLKEEILPAVGPPFPVVQTTPSYSFGFMPPMLVNPLVQPDAFDSQPPVSNSMSGSSPPISTSTSTPPPTQSTGVQNTVPMSPQPITLFRQPFPPNYIPYSHYYSPFYLPPAMHQYFGHTAFPPPMPTGNVYLTPPPGAAGMKISPAPYKLGANTGSQAPAGLPSGYGAYNSSQVAIGPNTTVTSGNSSSTEDLVPSALKENSVYPPVQQSEGPAVWLPAAGGRDAASFQLNSLMNVPPPHPHAHPHPHPHSHPHAHPQGQPVISPQSTPGAFAVYHALQPMAAPGPGGLTLLSHQPTMAGPTESVVVGPTSNTAYQQHQHPQRQQQQQQQPPQQMNWNV